jgi:hypothetical protein
MIFRDRGQLLDEIVAQYLDAFWQCPSGGVTQ